MESQRKLRPHLFAIAYRPGGPDGETAAAGVNVGELAQDGRLRSITRFFGEL